MQQWECPNSMYFYQWHSACISLYSVHKLPVVSWSRIKNQCLLQCSLVETKHIECNGWLTCSGQLIRPSACVCVCVVLVVGTAPQWTLKTPHPHNTDCTSRQTDRYQKDHSLVRQSSMCSLISSKSISAITWYSDLQVGGRELLPFSHMCSTIFKQSTGVDLPILGCSSILVVNFATAASCLCTCASDVTTCIQR